MLSYLLFLITWLNRAQSTSMQHFLVAIGPASPHDLVSQLSSDQIPAWLDPKLSAGIEVVTIKDLSRLTSLVRTAIGVIDATFSLLERETVAGVCEENQVPNLVLGYVNKAESHRWSYYVSGTQTDLGEALDSIVAFFNWTRVNVVTDSNSQLSAISILLQRNPTRTYQPLNFLSSDPGNIDLNVGKEMRMSGNRVNVFLTQADMTKSIIAAQYEKFIGGAGFGNLMPLTSSLYSVDLAQPSLLTGNLILAEEELWGVETMGEYYRSLLVAAVALFDNYTDTEAAKKSLDRRFPSHSRTGSFLLLNMQQGKRVPVGIWKNGVFATNITIYFLGNTTEVPQNAKSPLPISGNLGSRNPVGYSSTSPNYYKGALLAVDQINTWPTLLENFNLVLFNFTAGTSSWSYDFAKKNIAPYVDKLGLAVVAGSGSTVTINLISLLKEFGYQRPMIGSLNTVTSLSSKKDYPMYVRTIVSDDFVIQVYLQMFKLFKWTKCALLVSNETWGLGFQKAFTEVAKENGIEIINDREMQILPGALPSVDTLRNYTANFLHLIETKARILILVLNNNMFYVLDYLYELGMRAGDFEVVAHEGMSMSIFSTNDTEVNRKRSEIARGSIQFAPASFLGALGKQVYTDYQARFNLQPPVYACFYYDTVLSLAYAFDIIIRGGGDYTDSNVLMKSLRGSRFVGCTGTVTFEQNSNDRSPMQYNVLNAQLGHNDTYVTNITVVAIYDPSSTTLIKLVSDIMWCDGSTNVPPDIRQSTIGCPFEDKYDQEFLKGKILLYGVCSGVMLLTLIVTFLTWRKWRDRQFPPLIEKKEIQVEDVALMVGIVIELIQYIAIGPDVSFYSAQAFSIISTTTFELTTYVNYKQGGFNFVWMAVAIILGVWALMCLVVFLQLDYRMKWIPGCRTIGDLSELAVPIIGNTFFLPIVSILIDVFVCVKGVAITQDSVTFTDSYLHYDCFEKCWQDEHQISIIISAFAICVYLPAAILLRPFWQELTEQVNIKTAIWYLMFKTLMQVALIIINKTVKLANTLIHSCMFLGAMIVFIAFTLKFQCFNYKRTSLWNTLSLVAVCWSTILIIAYDTTGSSDYKSYMGAVAAGWVSIAIFGIVYQTIKIPSMLFRKPGVDTRVLFKFAFKRATNEMLSSLRDTFSMTGHRTRVIVPDSSDAPGSRYVVATEDISSRRNVVHTNRVTQKITALSE